MERVVPLITLKELKSAEFKHAFSVAEYRTRKNMRYDSWSMERRFEYQLQKGFEAVVKTRDKNIKELSC